MEKQYLTKKGHYLKGQVLWYFMRFWHAFDYKKGKADAADTFLKLYNKGIITSDNIDNICFSAVDEKYKRKKLPPGRTPIMAQGWLSGRRWEDEDDSTKYINQKKGKDIKELLK